MTTYPRIGSTGSAARSPVGSHSGNLPACSDSRADSGGCCRTHPHLKKNIRTFNFSYLVFPADTLSSIRRVKYIQLVDCVCSPSHSMPVLSNEKPLEHSQLKLPGVLTQEAREPQALF